MRRQILLVNIVSLLIGISYGMHNPILPIFASETIGATYSEIGAIGVANFAPYIFVPLFVGILLDRFNRGWILTAGVALNAVSTYALSIVHTVPEIMVCRIGTGIAHAFFWPPCEAIISSVSSGAERVRNIARFVGFFVAGFTIGPLLGSLLLSSAGFEYRTLFQLAAFVMAAALVSSISASRIRTVATSVRVSLSGFRGMISMPEVIMIVIYCTASFGAILAVYPAFLTEKGTSVVHVEILYFAFGVSRIITLLCAKKLAAHPAATINLAMFRTLSAPELTLEIIASQGGQKNACAMPVPILHTMISGTVCTMESAYVDTAFRATPAVRIHPRLNLSSSIPTNSGTKMYGAKFATPMAPISEYVAPIVSEANIGSIGLCMP